MKIKDKKDIQADIEAMDMLKKHTNYIFENDMDYILESIDEDISDVMNKYIKDGFVSKNGNLFFEDDEILDSFEYHLKGLQNLIKMTYKKGTE